MAYFPAITQAYNIKHHKNIHSLTFDLDHTSKAFTQDHNIKLVGFDLGFQTKLILHFYELPTKIYEM
jgi:hypothetical protein